MPIAGQKGEKMPARRYCAIPPSGGVPLLWWTGKLSTSQKNTAPPFIQQGRSLPSIRGGLSASIPAAFQSSVSCWGGCSGLRTISAPVGTILLPALRHCASQTAPGTSGYRQRVSVAFGGQLRRPRQHRHQGTKRAGRIVLRSWTLITACS